jgi:hypothetical protein
MSTPQLALTTDSDDDDLGLTARQINALERLSELNAEPAVPNPDKPGKMIYSPNPQIRALQLVFEGRFGGAGRGQGRPKPTQPRAAEVLADEIRKAPHVRKMQKALDRALRKDAGARTNLDAIKLSMEIEREERKLQLNEDKHAENYTGSKDDLVVELITALADPAAVAALDGYAKEEIDEEITDAFVVEDKEGNGSASDNGDERTNSEDPEISVDIGETGTERITASAEKIGNNNRSAGANDRKRINRIDTKGKKLSVKSKSGRSTKR